VVTRRLELQLDSGLYREGGERRYAIEEIVRLHALAVFFVQPRAPN